MSRSNDKTEATPPSDLFMSSFCCSGSPARLCELCGRLNYDMTGEFMDEGEVEGYTKRDAAEPAKYHGHDGVVSWGTIDGRTIVWGCPCNKAIQFERFIWKHRFQIAEYLKSRSSDELQSAKTQAEQIANVPTS